MARRLSISSEEQKQENLKEAAVPEPRQRPAWFWLLLVILSLAAVLTIVHLPQTPLERAVALIKANRAAAALPILEELAQKQPDSSQYLPWLAQGYLSTDRLAEGRTALDTALKVKLSCQTVAPILLNFSTYYRQKNDFAEAEKLLLSAQSVCPATEFQEERKAIYSQWADDDVKNNKIEEAIAHMEILAAMEPGKLPEKLAHKLADLLRQQAAVEETQKGDDKKAIALLEKSLSINDEPASRLALGNLYAKNNNFKNAIANLSQVCKADINNLEARHKLIDLLINTGDLQGAQDAAAELADREKSVENFQLLAGINLKLMNFAGAVRALEEASSLAPKDLELLKQLESALVGWTADLLKQGKPDEAATVKTRGERVAETVKALEKELNPGADAETATNASTAFVPGSPPITLTASRIWLSKGSLTPEGEIKLKNIGNDALNELALTVAFFDKTIRRRTGSVTVSAAGSSHPMPAGQIRTIYFSSPNIVRADHQLSVLIYWKGKLIRELPVVKEH
jgi:tetratricopeptide (TPR) repeat protein